MSSAVKKLRAALKRPGKEHVSRSGSTADKSSAPAKEEQQQATPSCPTSLSSPSEPLDEALLFPSWPPPGPFEILSRQDYYRERLTHRKYRAPRGIFEDSPLFALYRLYEWIMVDHYINIRNELECFWWARWPVASIPDPGEQGDPERYAVLSSIPALIVESFNERNELGLRRAEPSAILSTEEQLAWAATPKVYEAEPAWTKTVVPLEKTLHIPHTQPYLHQLESLDDPEASPSFKARNILIAKPHIHFI